MSWNGPTQRHCQIRKREKQYHYVERFDSIGSSGNSVPYYSPRNALRCLEDENNRQRYSGKIQGNVQLQVALRISGDWNWRERKVDIFNDEDCGLN